MFVLTIGDLISKRSTLRWSTIRKWDILRWSVSTIRKWGWKWNVVFYDGADAPSGNEIFYDEADEPSGNEMFYDEAERMRHQEMRMEMYTVWKWRMMKWDLTMKRMHHQETRFYNEAHDQELHHQENWQCTRNILKDDEHWYRLALQGKCLSSNNRRFIMYTIYFTMTRKHHEQICSNYLLRLRDPRTLYSWHSPLIHPRARYSWRTVSPTMRKSSVLLTQSPTTRSNRAQSWRLESTQCGLCPVLSEMTICLQS